ncbi:3100_t:CDS:2 [Paraglomus occultum]|uniref:3100_t:CDS:1 n=1 Tax=Paraglomus occultum TaxID=144539 RepID=A0A9N9A6U2_9GLOM|nr:3100_t:CDS:2 [Paraglomus occultum]
MSMPLAPQIAPFDYRLVPGSIRRIPESRMKHFFGKIIPLKFASVKDASATCRALAKDFGFTLKQETSSSKNIYLYCSREGIPDSRKGNKPIKRKRASIRCDCKWRIILFQNDADKQWEFRQSQNPQHCEHNHELIPPELMPRPWPTSMLERIAYYVNLGVRTNEIRTAIQREFPDQPWDERRFYNRLSDERSVFFNIKKIFLVFQARGFG